ncbi:MAG: Holliday junction resolvase RuvX [Phycisphaerae bacterium]
MTCYIGIDYGLKRIGLAVGDRETGIASPLKTIAAAGPPRTQAKAVADVARDYAVDGFVLGLPLNMDGSEGEQAKLTRTFGSALMTLTNLPVHYHDERLSSRSAAALLAPAELTPKQRGSRVDHVAAQIILKSFLEGRPRRGETPSS